MDNPDSVQPTSPRTSRVAVLFVVVGSALIVAVSLLLMMQRQAFGIAGAHSPAGSVEASPALEGNEPSLCEDGSDCESADAGDRRGPSH